MLTDREVMRAQKNHTAYNQLPRNQTTLTGPCTISGRGYWSGESNVLTFLPAPAGTGIRFVRTDLPGRPSVAATADYRSSMPLRTLLSDGRCEVAMVEHVLAALAGLRIDNCEVHCTAAEMPGMDGSCRDYVLALDSVGKTELRARRAALQITERIRLGTTSQWIMAEPVTHRTLEVEYQLDYGADSPITRSTYRNLLEEDIFYHDIAPARTFISLADAQALQQQGLARHVTERDLLVFDEHGPIHNQLRFADECARHKALDLIGDLALTGIDLVGRVTAFRSGHQLNGQMAEKLRTIFMSQCSATKAA
ncbi:MAG: UDP-3-O-acyl-N-acetylglucosamine deacetylase [Pirellulaceae bacterium]